MKHRYRLLIALAFTGVVGLAAILLSPKPALYAPYSFSSALQDRDGRLMRLSLAGDQRYRLFTPLQGFPAHVIRATLLYEDRHFYRHPGVNPMALTRSAWSTYVRRSRVMGGSTITMQLARLRFAMDTRNIPGKLTQILRALQLERHYTKDEILEAYLNLAPYGGNIEGLGTAALIYFEKPAAQLSLSEAAALAVIPQNPVARNPVSAQGHNHMLAARTRLLDIWNAQSPLTGEQLAILELPLSIRPATALPFAAPHVAQMLLAKPGVAAGVHRTTVSLQYQHLLEQTIDRYLERRTRFGIHNASAMLVDHRSMEVLAAVGSADFFDATIAGQVDGTRAKRSPGSTLKPFVYAMAMDEGIIHPMSMLKDAPKRFGVYTPENFDRGFMGPVSAEEALIYSRNVPAIELLAQVGYRQFHEFLQAADVGHLKSAEHYGLAMILGGNELTMEELARLYAMLPNGGRLKSLRYLHSAPPADEGLALLSPEASFLVLDMLRNNPRPDRFANRRSHAKIPVAWKTGTSYAYRDAWTAGVLGPYVLVVWVGNFDGTGNPELIGRQAAAPLFFELSERITAGLPDGEYGREPHAALNLRRVPVCAGTGDLPGRHCPATEPGWFIPGVSPIRVSTVHRAILVDSRTGKRSCHFDAGYTRTQVFEFWPSDIARLQQQAGISRRRPPAWEDSCALDGQAATGIAPRITSPAPSLRYYIRPEFRAENPLPLTATVDADVERLFWFVNDSFVGQSQRENPLLWQPQPGEFDILVVDDLGRSASSHLTVTTVQ
ncbi:MAG: penicillin-binding protein 1C [Gammaproteobacteria bacterium]|nr:penicillin-binding protein 1C [Gammaproteobacteria bacterium]